MSLVLSGCIAAAAGPAEGGTWGGLRVHARASNSVKVAPGILFHSMWSAHCDAVGRFRVECATVRMRRREAGKCKERHLRAEEKRDVVPALVPRPLKEAGLVFRAPRARAPNELCGRCRTVHHRAAVHCRLALHLPVLREHEWRCFCEKYYSVHVVLRT